MSTALSPIIWSQGLFVISIGLAVGDASFPVPSHRQDGLFHRAKRLKHADMKRVLT